MFVLPLFLLALFGTFRVSLYGRGEVVDDCPVGVEMGERKQIDEDADAVALGQGLGVVPVKNEFVQEQQ